MDAFRRSTTALLVLLGFAVALFAVLPLDGLGQQIYYDVVAALAMVLGFAAVAHHRPRRPWGWLLTLAGLSCWVLGDIVWSIEQYGFEVDNFPAPSDAVYIAGYGALVAGALLMVRTRRGSGDSTALLDALIIAVGAGVVVTTFVIAPLAADSNVTSAAKIVSTFYPIADLVLLALLARLWATPNARTYSCLLLTSAIGLTLIVDLIWNVWLVSGVVTTGATGQVSDAMWLASYVLAAAAAVVPSMKNLGEPMPDREAVVPSPRRLIGLGIGLALPAVVLLVEGARGKIDDLWPVIGVGMLALTCLILARMSGLLRLVANQSNRLEAVARSDALTGAPNRRTFDHELDRSCGLARENATPLCVAMLDLDHFKAFNDTYGHQAGDLLLREAVAAWTHTINDRGMLARYGGEEFAVILPDTSLHEATQLIRSLRGRTPSDQTFSAGVSLWDPASDPLAAVAWADAAMYQAKRTGRDRVVAHDGRNDTTGGTGAMPTLSLVVQPIVRLSDMTIVGHEVLSRFHGVDDDVQRVYSRAHAHGYGDLLEAAAILGALDLPDRPVGQELYVNASPMALASARFWDRLPERLDGIVFEISEVRDGVDEKVLSEMVQALRERGARMALDDLGGGGGTSELARLAALRPDVVKVDRSVVAGCATDPVRSAVLSALNAYASKLGVIVCAEGVDNYADLEHLIDIGITHAQGYLLGRPMTEWHTIGANQSQPLRRNMPYSVPHAPAMTPRTTK